MLSHETHKNTVQTFGIVWRIRIHIPDEDKTNKE